MRIFIVSDAPWHETGYGRLSRSLARRMVADGHRVFIFAPGGFHGGRVEWGHGITVLSSEWGDDRWGNGSFQHRVRKANPDLIITLLDPQGLASYGHEAQPAYCWAPIDTWPIPKQERGILSRFDKIMAPSRWGVEVVEAAGLKAEYLPYGIEPGEFYYDPEGRKKFRKMLGVQDDTFLIGMIGVNSGMPDRKGFPFAFEAIARFAARHPNTRAYVQSNVIGGSGGPNLSELREELGLENVVMLPSDAHADYLPTQAMRDMLSAFDVLLYSSMTEGFGLPVIEAQACGTPVVANAATSVAELLGPGCIPCVPLGEMYVQTSTKISIPSVEALADGLEGIYGAWHGGAYRLQRTGDPQFTPEMAFQVLERYAWDRVYERYWQPLLLQVPGPTVHERGRKLQLGCGLQPKEGYVHNDRTAHHDYVDAPHDLTVFPWPWEDESFDYIDATDVFEHLRGDVTAVLDECWRILAPGGWLYIHTCEAGDWTHYMDPTHVQAFKLESFDYYDPETRWGQIYGCYSASQWRIGKKSLQDGQIEVVMTPRKGDGDGGH